ncbi:MAG: phosphoenolpyruvate--protein phosphotransferase [Neisseriaceae bacterium]
MSLVLYGVGVGQGYAVGRVHLLSSGLDDVPQYSIKEEELEAEVKRYESAVRRTKEHLIELKKNIPSDAPTELGTFLSFHLMLLADANLSQAPIELIREKKINTEWALRQQLTKLLGQFDSMTDEYLRTRKQDLIQVVEKIYNSLSGVKLSNIQPNDLFEDVVLVATDISPAEVMLFRGSGVVAFTTDLGGPTSHTAILGRTLDIPSVFGLRNARDLLKEDEWVIVDGVNGVVILDPDKVILEEYREKIQLAKKNQLKLNKFRNISAKTKDGVSIELLANIESIADITASNKAQVVGIGLFRSEFLFLNRPNMPTEDEQFEYYMQLVESLGGKPLTIRTIDIGREKKPTWLRPTGVLNPAMGLTGIRLSLAEPIMFRTQMRAILRAGLYGKIKLLWPMIASLSELKRCLSHLEIAKEQLSSRGEPFNSNIEVGIMVEIPSAALTIASLLKYIDFISIGTNDLIQYTMAVDRSDDTVNYLYQPLHPAVLKLINHTIKTAFKQHKPVTICGEMAADPRLTRVLLGLGLRSFSLNFSSVLPVKSAIVNTDIRDLEGYVTRLLYNENPDRIEDLLSKINGDGSLE